MLMTSTATTSQRPLPPMRRCFPSAGSFVRRGISGADSAESRERRGHAERAVAAPCARVPARRDRPVRLPRRRRLASARLSGIHRFHRRSCRGPAPLPSRAAPRAPIHRVVARCQERVPVIEPQPASPTVRRAVRCIDRALDVRKAAPDRRPGRLPRTRQKREHVGDDDG